MEFIMKLVQNLIASGQFKNKIYHMEVTNVTILK